MMETLDRGQKAHDPELYVKMSDSGRCQACGSENLLTDPTGTHCHDCRATVLNDDGPSEDRMWSLHYERVEQNRLDLEAAGKCAVQLEGPSGPHEGCIEFGPPDVWLCDSPADVKLRAWFYDPEERAVVCDEEWCCFDHAARAMQDAASNEPYSFERIELLALKGVRV
jgi:hypothetical protein